MPLGSLFVSEIGASFRRVLRQLDVLLQRVGHAGEHDQVVAVGVLIERAEGSEPFFSSSEMIFQSLSPAPSSIFHEPSDCSSRGAKIDHHWHFVLEANRGCC